MTAQALLNFESSIEKNNNKLVDSLGLEKKED
jgi:hypothetical protein